MSLKAVCDNKPTEATITIPFDSVANAEIAYRVLSVDQEPRRNFVQKQLRVQGDQLEVHFTADQVKSLRTAISSFFEALLLCTDTIKTFGPAAAATAAADNAGAHASANTA